MIEFQLFRIKVFPGEPILFDPPRSRSEILRRAIESKPEGTLRGRTKGHVGDVERLDLTGYYFRFGRTTRATLEQFSGGHFSDAEYETTPYTHVLVDVELEVATIAKKTRLAQTIPGIANQLARLLTASSPMRELGARIEIVPIQDPEEFIKYIIEAHSISQFSMTLSLPNPFDANHDFVKPAQRALSEINGEKGRVTMSGSDLKSGPLVEFSRSAASTGDDATVRLKESAATAPIRRHLRGKAVTVYEKDVDTAERKRRILDRIRSIYLRIRGTVE